MYITYRERRTGVVTRAYFERHTMGRTMRRYPNGRYEAIDADLSPRCVRLAGSERVARSR